MSQTRIPLDNLSSHDLESTSLLRPQKVDQIQESGGDGHHGPSNGSVWGSVFNLCNSAIGAGILALPYAIRETGVVLGAILIFCMALLCSFSLKIIIWANRLHPEATSYERLVLLLFGKNASIVVTFSVIMTTFGACTGFLVIIGDLMTAIISILIPDPAWVSSRIFVTAVLSVVGVLPLASLKNFNTLRFSSTIAIVSVTFTVFVIILKSAQHLHLDVRSDVQFFILGPGIFDALPLITFAFGCHLQVVPIFSELSNNHIPSRINYVILSTNLVCVILYSCTGVFGYLNFFGATQGNILKNYSDHDVLANVARGVLSFVIICHYPPSNYCCRAAMDYLFFSQAKASTPRRLAWTAIIWGLAFVVAITLPQINIVFGLIGATANSLVVFIFPAIFLIKLCNYKLWEGFRGTEAKIIGWAILVFGIILSVVGTTVIILENWFPSTLKH